MIVPYGHVDELGRLGSSTELVRPRARRGPRAAAAITKTMTPAEQPERRRRCAPRDACRARAARRSTTARTRAAPARGSSVRPKRTLPRIRTGVGGPARPRAGRIDREEHRHEREQDAEGVDRREARDLAIEQRGARNSAAHSRRRRSARHRRRGARSGAADAADRRRQRTPRRRARAARAPRPRRR